MGDQQIHYIWPDVAFVPEVKVQALGPMGLDVSKVALPISDAQ